MILILISGLILQCLSLWGVSKGVDSTQEDILILRGVFVFTTLVLLLAIFSFYILNITLDQEFLRFKLGIGWFQKKYPLCDISSVEIVKPGLLTGVGIRYLGKGWLYNVSYGPAIQLRFKNKTSVVQIGCDQAEELELEIRRQISSAKEEESSSQN